jgi:hypothetical protein
MGHSRRQPHVFSWPPTDNLSFATHPITRRLVCIAPARSSFDRHNDPIPRYVITSAGVLEFITGGGETCIIHPGDVLLAEDHTGSGHKWPLTNDEPRNAFERQRRDERRQDGQATANRGGLRPTASAPAARKAVAQSSSRGPWGEPEANAIPHQSLAVVLRASVRHTELSLCRGIRR